MKKLYFTLLVLFIFSANCNAQQYELNRLKTNLYYDIFDSLLNSDNLNDFSFKLNQINFEKEPPVYSNDNEYYTIIINLPDDEKILIVHENPSGNVSKIVFIHRSSIYNSIKSYP